MKKTKKLPKKKPVSLATEQKCHPTAMEFAMALVIMLALLVLGKTAVILMGW
jgi:hypothetical protein